MKSLDKFLKNHIPDDGQSCTHTRIGNASLNLYGGKYYISPEDLPEFYKLYHKKVFLEKKDEYLVEKPNPDGFPILIVLDFSRISRPSSVTMTFLLFLSKILMPS